ncbi:MAG: hypothetical protein A3I09_04160 [Deltaproteobacteria bacterium RIFCSPLOWO2_02_FULL_47_10]|nr:MAG: hypothetical protein A3I09_04160 [Deltaproteobacteria bacterium RIFCSPLOWO2_02_FULL_47_10]
MENLVQRLFKDCLILVCAVVIMAGCAKKPIQIGRENPEIEIQKCIKLSDKKHFEEAIECLEMFKSRFPKSQWGIEAELYIGDNYFRQRDYLMAADSYQAFVKLHPTHPKVDYAYYKTGLSYLKHSPKAIDRDQEYLDDSIANFEIVSNNYPDTPYLNLTQNYLTEARTKVARRHFYVGRFYYRTGEYIAAVPRFKEIADKYRSSNLAEKSLYLMTLSNIELGRLDDAKLAFSQISQEYPKSKYIGRLSKKLLHEVKKKGA